ncbi:MAG: hypothetical protein ACHQIK_18330 [Candidatus Acidiferrales bacterium]
MTICAAGINQPYDSTKAIIAVSDRKFSWGVMSVDAGWKVQTIHPKWRVMFAGPLSPLVALIDAVKSSAANADRNSLRSFARLCSRAYREEREHIIETEILAEHDIDSYAEYQALRKSPDRELFDALTEKIKKQEEEWNLLFIGFDDAGRPHIFVITEYGKIQYCDAEGFAVIGSGAYNAQHVLSHSRFNRFMLRGEAAYCLLAAKFAAESADGVGETTAFMILKATDRLGRTVPGLNADDIEKIKDEWKAMPVFPQGAAERIETVLANHERELRIKVENPLKGFKRSVSRKSKRVR